MKMILAINKKMYIGLDGDLPWKRNCSADLKHFKKLTMGGKLMVGRVTYENLPKLKGRTLIVVGEGYNTLQEALDQKPDWVIGGKSLYESTVHLCNELHISVINDETIGDTSINLLKLISDTNAIIRWNTFDLKQIQ
jgi:dihydrofolate reductase